MARNQFKTEANPTEENATVTNGDKKSTSTSKTSFNIFRPITLFFTNEKFLKITGVTLIVLSIFCILSFASYLFTWKIDQDKLSESWSNILFNNDIILENWMGKFGGLISHQFIYGGFGVTSFIFAFLFFLLGFRILFKVELLPIKKMLLYSMFTIVWLSVTFGFVFTKQPILGGTFGYEANLWLISIVGKIGVGLVLAFVLLIFLIANFNISFNIFKFKSAENINDEEIEDEEENESFSIKQANKFKENKLNEDLIENEISQLRDEKPIEVEDLEEDGIEEPITLSTLSNEKDQKKPIDDSGVSFVVEATAEVEEILTESEINSKVAEFGEYDPTLDLSSYQLPSIELLKDFGNTQRTVTQ